MRGTRTIQSRVAISHVVLVATILVLFVAFASCMFWWNLRNTLSRYAILHIHTVEDLSLGTDGRLVVSEDFRDHFGWIRERFVEIRDFNNGEVVYRNQRLGNRSLGSAPFAGEGTNYSPRVYRMADGTHVFLVSHVHDIDHKKLLVRQGYSIEPFITRLKEFVGILCLSIPVTLVLAGLAGFRFARKTLEPLENMTIMAEHITPKRLNERLPVANSADELGRLALVINMLLERIQNDVDQLQRFTADVSHELRTPLAALRSVGEVALQRPANKSEYVDAIGSMLEEANRLTRLVDSLLMISRMDAGQVPLKLTECNVFDLIQQCVTLLDVVAQEKSQTLTFNASGDGVISADELLLRHAFINVIHNAIKYSPSGSTIEVQACAIPAMGVEVKVDDEGPGIAKESQPKIFERFYRLPPFANGAGLGLAITKWIVEAHHGVISVTASASGGSRFTIRLPNHLLESGANGYPQANRVSGFAEAKL